MRTILTKAEQLALIGAPVEHEHLLDMITEDLGDEFRPVVEMLNARDVLISLEELHGKIINRENALLSASAVTTTVIPMTANTAQFSSQQQSSRGNYRGGFGSQGNYRNLRPYHGKCQFFGAQMHSARKCPQLSVSLSSAPQRVSSPWPQQPPPPPQAHWNPQAHYTMATPSDTAVWLLESGASHHVASDLSTLLFICHIKEAMRM